MRGSRITRYLGKRDVVKIVGIATMASVVSEAISRQYLWPVLTGFLDGATFCFLILGIIVCGMRMKGRL